MPFAQEREQSEPRRKWLFAIAAFLLIGMLLYWWSDRRANGKVESSPDVLLPQDGQSNVRASDYVGPQECAPCHEERYLQWSTNLHRKMNRLVSEPGAVLGDFSEGRIPYGPGALLLQKTGQTYVMSLEEVGDIVRSFRLTRTIGSRYLQEYVGIQTEGPEPAGHSVYKTEIRLPFGYLIGMKRWIHQQYFDSWHDKEYSESSMTHNPFEVDQTPWRARCAWCHNTYAFENRLARMQGDMKIGSGVEQLYTDLRQDTRPAEERLLLDTESLVSVGISCESCHFGARGHAQDGETIHFAPLSPSIVPVPEVAPLSGERKDARSINSICAQCHSAPTLLYPNGAGTRNSSEALDLLSGNCASEIKCTDCHDPHVPGPGAMAEVVPRHLSACTGCHQQYEKQEDAAFHSLHGPEVSCLDCHMPRIVQGMASLLRSHRISSPEDILMLRSSVNACNLCHLDKSVAWTANELRLSHGARLPPDESWPEEETAIQWLHSKDRIVRLTAAGSLGIRPIGKKYVSELLRLLNDPVAYDRLRYLWAIEGVLGRKLTHSEFDVSSDPETRRRQAASLLSRELSRGL